MGLGRCRNDIKNAKNKFRNFRTDANLLSEV